VKGAFIDSPPEAFAKATGGTQFHFVRQKGLEAAIQTISQELHSQYMLSYSPNNRDEGGWHEIRVTIDQPGLSVRTRPGYWLGASAAQ
jgi:VWFA-related protein